jgi:tetratricopeptide (TPR) repeat protein
MNRDSYTLTQNVRGSIGYDSNFNNVFLSNRNLVGRSGAAIQLFVDNDSNGSYNDGDELLKDAKLRIGRGGTQSFTKNGILYYTHMNSFYRYNMEVNIATISNPMLVPAYDKFSIITDPNRFKKILIPFNTSGVMEGQALRKLKNDNTTGIGGLKVLLQELTTNETKELRTFSDGSFYEYPIAPGNYVVTVDPSQLNLLNVRSEPEKIEFEVKVTPNGDFVEGLNFTLIPNKETENNEVDSTRIRSIEAITEEVIASSEMLAYSNELSKQVNEALRLIIQAQNAFYLKDMNKAFRLVSESLEIFETAQGHALKGSFYYFEGNIEQAQRQWNNALRYNPDMYIPNMELLEQVIDIK